MPFRLQLGGGSWPGAGVGRSGGLKVEEGMGCTWAVQGLAVGQAAAYTDVGCMAGLVLAVPARVAGGTKQSQLPTWCPGPGAAGWE